MTALDEQLDHAGRYAHSVLIDNRHGELTATYFLTNAKGEITAVACPWRGEAEKIATLAAVRKIAADCKATTLLMVSEVWMTEESPDTPRALRVQPSQNPKRREFVLALATDGQKTKTARWQIVRDRPGGSIIALVADPIGDADQFSGRIIDGILPPRGTGR